ncbi:MAG: hypothetical protein LBU32_28460 [Clostridiales bacterium]|jgi:hypothetical protein|nr:hypothetical protein [Clostridiales bacterium]
MTGTCKIKSCVNFKSIERELPASLSNIHEVNCKDCVYFSSRNCGMDASSVLEEATILC